MEPYPLRSGWTNPDSFPSQELADAASRILPGLSEEMAQYPGELGYEPLRRLMAERFEKREGMALPVDEIALTTGSMQGVTLMAQTLIKKPGDVIVMEEFSYAGTIDAYQIERAELVGIPLDEDGMRMDALEDALRNLAAKGKKPKFIYTLVTYQNPTGSIMPIERRRELLQIADRYEVPVVEDHCYADTIYEDCHVPALYTLPHEVPVIHIESLSKILGPGLRVGYFTAPQPLLDDFLNFRRDAGPSLLNAAVLYEYLRENLWDHVDRNNAMVKLKRDAMLHELSKSPDVFEWFSKPKGGLFVWVKMPDSTDLEACEQLAGSRGIDYATGKAFHVYGEDVPYLRLAFGYPTVDEIKEGVSKLADCVRETQRTPSHTLT